MGGSNSRSARPHLACYFRYTYKYVYFCNRAMCKMAKAGRVTFANVPALVQVVLLKPQVFDILGALAPQ